MKYIFSIIWNTGDPYWDDTPMYDEFDGTLEELIEYLKKESSEDMYYLTKDYFDPVFTNGSVSDSSEEIWRVCLAENYTKLFEI